MSASNDQPAATALPWDTIRRLRSHLESEQRYAFVDALDKLGERACMADEYASMLDTSTALAGRGAEGGDA